MSKAFSDWMREQRVAKQADAVPSKDETLPDGVWLNVHGRPMATCSGCGYSYEIEDVSEYHCDVSYCGGGPRCVP